jgi:microcystin-dependent protein
VTNPTQVLRSTVAGNRPTGKLPGEPFVNYPDLQFGVVDVAGTAVDLIAVRFFSATAHYNIGDHVLQGGVLYRAIAATGPGAFAPASWTRGVTRADATATYLPLAGGTMTGLLLLSGEPVAALGAATKQTVDSKLPLAGGGLTGDIAISKASPSLVLSKPASGTFCVIYGQTNGVSRWIISPGDADAESVGNAGSNFSILRYSDAGTLIEAPFKISRANGQVTVAQPLNLPGNPVSALQAAPKQYVDAAVPAGVIFPFAGAVNAVPAGWFACNGQNITRAANPNLYALFLNMTGGLAVWGAGDGSTTFGLPDLRGRAPAGIDDMGTGAAGRLATGAAGNFVSVGIGGFGGIQRLALIESELVDHNHLFNSRNNPTAFSTNGAGNTQGGTIVSTGTMGMTGGPYSQSHNNMQPTLLVNYIIRGG